MFGEIDRAGIEAVLGRGITWVDEEDSLDVTYLADKAAREGLTAQEESEYDALQALYCSGR
jgi:hypothetical protein